MTCPHQAHARALIDACRVVQGQSEVYAGNLLSLPGPSSLIVSGD